MLCTCGGDIRPKNNVGIIGTRDSFGIGKSFVDDRTGKTIDNWRDWEKAGYKQAKDAPPDRRCGDIKEMVKEKQAKKRR